MTKEKCEKIRNALTEEDIKTYKEKYPKVFETLKNEDVPDKTIIMGIIAHKKDTKEELIAGTLFLLAKLAQMETMATMVADALGAAIGGNPTGDGEPAKHEA